MLTDQEAKTFLAGNLTRMLRDRGMSLRALARLTNETPMRLSNAARGATIPDVACVSRIAEALGVSIEDLIAPISQHSADVA